MMIDKTTEYAKTRPTESGPQEDILRSHCNSPEN